MILFRDGLEVDGELLQSHWHLPLRKLAIAMPLTAVIVAALARWLIGLSWTEALLLGALLSPTDPVLSSGVVTDPRVPRVIRHSLNLESGLNDGLALPAVLAFAAALAPGSSGFVWWHFVLQDIGFGLAFGLACGAGGLAADAARGARAAGPSDPRPPAGALRPRPGVRDLRLTVLPPHGNGFIAVFVAAIVIGVRRPDLRQHFAERSQEIVEIVKLGDLHRVRLAADAARPVRGRLGGRRAGASAVLLIARPIAVWAALAGTRVRAATKAFMAWFGPKGVATMAFSLLILSRHVQAGSSDLQPRRARRLRLDHPARPDRHARHELDRRACGAWRRAGAVGALRG